MVSINTKTQLTQAQSIANISKSLRAKQQDATGAEYMLDKSQGLSASEMASVIKEVKNPVLNFNGTIDQFKKYIMCYVLAGELSIEKGSYKKTVKTNDGNVYEVEVRKPNEDEKLLIGEDDAITVEAKRKEVNGTKSSEYISPSTVAISQELVEKAKQELPQLKKLYGEI